MVIMDVSARVGLFTRVSISRPSATFSLPTPTESIRRRAVQRPRNTDSTVIQIAAAVKSPPWAQKVRGRGGRHWEEYPMGPLE